MTTDRETTARVAGVDSEVVSKTDAVGGIEQRVASGDGTSTKSNGSTAIPASKATEQDRTTLECVCKIEQRSAVTCLYGRCLPSLEWVLSFSGTTAAGTTTDGNASMPDIAAYF